MKRLFLKTMATASFALLVFLVPAVVHAQGTLFVEGDKVGVGIATPTEKLHVLESTNGNTFITAENSGGGSASAGVLRARSNTAVVNFQAHGSGRTISRFGRTLGGWAEFLQVGGNGLAIGTLGGTPLILGTNSTNVLEITPAGNVLFKGSQVHPDYVFEPDYELESIEDHAAYMWENKHLPAVGAGEYTEDGRAAFDLGQSRAGMLEELEKAHIYIDQINDRLTQEEQRNQALEERLATLEAKLDASGN
jgi:hypothetical protein